MIKQKKLINDQYEGKSMTEQRSNAKCKWLHQSLNHRTNHHNYITRAGENNGALGQEYSTSGCLRPIKENVYLREKMF